MPRSVDTLLAMDDAKSGVPVLQMGLSDTSEALERSSAVGACQQGSPSRHRMCRWCAEGVPAPGEDISPNVVQQNPWHQKSCLFRSARIEAHFCT